MRRAIADLSMGWVDPWVGLCLGRLLAIATDVLT